MAENCGGCNDDCKACVVPNIVINITFNDNRMDEDASTYVDNVIMEDGGGDEITLDME